MLRFLFYPHWPTGSHLSWLSYSQAPTHSHRGHSSSEVILETPTCLIPTTHHRHVMSTGVQGDFQHLNIPWLATEKTRITLEIYLNNTFHFLSGKKTEQWSQVKCKLQLRAPGRRSHHKRYRRCFAVTFLEGFYVLQTAVTVTYLSKDQKIHQRMSYMQM